MFLIMIRRFQPPFLQIHTTYIQNIHTYKMLRKERTRRIIVYFIDLKINHSMLKKLSGNVILA